MILAVERAVLDLTDLGCEDAVRNQLVIRSLESKLPDVMKRKWLMCVRNPVNDVHPGNRFDRLLMFLEDQKSFGSCYPANNSLLMLLRDQATRRNQVTEGERSRSPRLQQVKSKLFRCKTLRKANLSEKKSQVKKVKACTKCLDVHRVESDCTPKFLCRKEECKKGDTPADHHYFLCPEASTKKDAAKRENKAEEKRGTQGPTEEQEAVFAELELTPHQPRAACNKEVLYWLK